MNQDQGTGPPTDASRPSAPDHWLLATLTDAGVLDQATAARLGPANGSYWRAITGQGLATDAQILDAVSIRHRVPVADLSAVDGRFATLLPETIARKYQVVAVGADERLIRIATVDPRDLTVEQTLAFVTGRNVVFLAAAPDHIAAKLDEIYRPEAAVNRLVEGFNPSTVETIDDDLSYVEETKDPSLDAPMARLVDAMIADGVREGASDIHCEPMVDGTSIRYRIDGVTKIPSGLIKAR